MNLGETTAEVTLINDAYQMQRRLVDHTQHIRDHLQSGDYPNVVFHLTIIQLSCMALAEEMVRVLVSEFEMAELVAQSAGGLGGMVAVTLRDLQTMKIEEAEEGE
jgi:hypothetical protein